MNLLLSMLIVMMSGPQLNTPCPGAFDYNTAIIEKIAEKTEEKQKKEERNNFVKMVSQYEGCFTYVLGAKADKDWALPTELDCSGFTQYMFHEYFGIDIGGGTFLQSMDLVEDGKAHYISYEELKPGDLGFIYRGVDTIIKEGEEIFLLENHVGIYMGKDNNGNDLWCHCNAKDGTVVINSVDYFTTFVNVID